MSRPGTSNEQETRDRTEYRVVCEDRHGEIRGWDTTTDPDDVPGILRHGRWVSPLSTRWGVQRAEVHEVLEPIEWERS